MCISSSRLPLSLLVLLLLRPCAAQEGPAGAAAVDQALKRLGVLGSVLMIAAHPDDENTNVLAYFARGRHLRTAYLSATRGEGGQNLIGPEQGELLGLIRTQELLAARRIDGAEQFFTRAIDFGYSKSSDETLEKWGRERILSDMVWVIRRFRPDVVVLRFSGTGRDGHGHHRASAILGKEAFSAAADPRRFPEQLKWVAPWQAKRAVWNVFSFSAEQQKEAAALAGRVEIDTGEYNPVLGRSYTELAGRSRSMHRSQGMGSPERRGQARNFFVHVEGEPARKDVFDGIDTTWNRLPGGAEIARLVEEAVRVYEPERPEKAIPPLLKARPLVAAVRDPWGPVKLRELDEAVALCAGLWVDAAAGRWAAAPGGAVTVRATALNRSRTPLRLERVELAGLGTSEENAGGATLEYNRPVTREFKRPVPAGQPYSQPFWLVRPPVGASYDVDRQELIGVPDTQPVLEARFVIDAGGTKITLTRPVRYRYVDKVYGELTRALEIVPRVALNLPENVFVFPRPGARTVHVEAAPNVESAAGEARVMAPQEWTVEPRRAAFKADAGEHQALGFSVTPPAAEGTATLRAATDGITAGMRVIAYPHIPPQTVFTPAEAKLVRVDARVNARRVGYVMGAGDEVPAALRQLGCEVRLLGQSDLEQRDLAEFDAIVTGVRAYNVRADLRANQPRLLEYVKNGGTLVVQYNVMDSSLAGVKLGPYPMTIGRERVTVEEAPVRFPNPGHALLSSPNRISARDFEGWVQERGLYFATKWDPRYESVLEMSDPGEKPLGGGQLWASYGKGVYVFTALSWFRQLPAGVPGAYRLFGNLLSAK